jgi:hypothetical protein
MIIYTKPTPTIIEKSHELMFTIIIKFIKAIFKPQNTAEITGYTVHVHTSNL